MYRRSKQGGRMENNKLISYDELREYLLKEGKQYFTKVRFRKPEYELRIKEEEDDFQNPEEKIYLFNWKQPDKQVPSYDFMVLYENYMRCQDVKKVVAFLMETIEKEYPEEAEKEQEKLPEAYVATVPVEGDEDVGNVYFLAEDKMQYGVPDLLKQDDILGSIAEKENANLQMISCGDNAVMAIPVETLEEYAENLDVLAELYQLEQEKEAESQVYDRSRNVLVKDPEEIKELLLKGKVKKKGIFSR